MFLWDLKTPSLLIGETPSLRIGANRPAGRHRAPARSGAPWMRCIYCHEKAGLVRRVCAPCAKVIAIVEKSEGQIGLAGMVDIFIAEGLTQAQVDRVLDAQVGGAPTIRDRLTSDMANVLMRNLGMPGRQSPDDVQRVRESMKSGGGAGTWTAGEKPSGWQH
jgi:hypothetical protein